MTMKFFMIRCFTCLGWIAKVSKKERTFFMTMDFQN